MTKFFQTNSALGSQTNDYVRSLVNAGGPPHFVFTKAELEANGFVAPINFSLIGPHTTGKARSGLLCNLSWEDGTLAAFFRAYAQDLQAGQGMYISEFTLTQSRFRMFMDLDIKISADVFVPDTTPPEDERLKNRFVPALPVAFRRAMLTVIHRVVRGVVWQSDDDMQPAEMVVCERVPTRGKKGNRLNQPKTYYKHGLHLHWPDFVVNWRQALLIRLFVVMELQADDPLTATLTLHNMKLFDENVAGGRPWDWNQVVDDDVYANASVPAHLRLVGSVRVMPNTEFKTPPYVPVCVIDALGNWSEERGKALRKNVPEMVSTCSINAGPTQRQRTRTFVDADPAALLDEQEWVLKVSAALHLDNTVVTKCLVNANRLKHTPIQRQKLVSYKKQREEARDGKLSAAQDFGHQVKRGHIINLPTRTLAQVTKLLAAPVEDVRTLPQYMSRHGEELARVDPQHKTPPEFYHNVIALFYQFWGTAPHQRRWQVTGINSFKDQRFYLWTNCRYCPNHGSEHSTRSIYFFVDMLEKLVGVRCKCACMGKVGVLGTPCRNMREIVFGAQPELLLMLREESDQESGQVISQHMKAMYGPVPLLAKPPKKAVNAISPHHVYNYCGPTEEVERMESRMFDALPVLKKTEEKAAPKKSRFAK